MDSFEYDTSGPTTNTEPPEPDVMTLARERLAQLRKVRRVLKYQKRAVTNEIALVARTRRSRKKVKQQKASRKRNRG